MTVRICGHRLRVRKPIKVYTLLKQTAALLVLSVILITPAYAADLPMTPGKEDSSSSAGAIPCLPSKDRLVNEKVPLKTLPLQAQRSAGPPSAAMALAMALGVRNISGPVEHAAAMRPSAQRPALSLAEGCALSKTSNRDVPSRIAMEK